MTDASQEPAQGGGGAPSTGNWYVVDFGEPYYLDAIESQFAIQDQGGPVAYLFNARHAALAAAAPDLLGVAMAYDAEMLRRFPSGPCGHPATLDAYDQTSWLFARAAILKATQP